MAYPDICSKRSRLLRLTEYSYGGIKSQGSEAQNMSANATCGVAGSPVRIAGHINIYP